MNGELAEALTGQVEAESLLRRAEERGLFVTRIGPDGWFSVHSLVRTVLRTELSRQPELLARQHERAGRWFADAGDTAVALDHLVQSGDLRGTLRLLAAKHADLYDDGREATIRRVIAAIPAELATSDIDALVDFTWCHLLVNRRRFAELVEQLTWWTDRSAADTRLASRVRILASIGATVNGDWLRGGMLARQALGELGDGWWRDPLGRFGWNMLAREVALGERWDERSDEVRELDLALSRDPHRRVALEGTRALGEVMAGRPIDALRVVAGVRHASPPTGLTILRAELGIAEALAYRELADRTRAVQALEAIATTPAETMYYCRVLATLELTMAALDDGDLTEARRRFSRAVGLVKEERGVGWWTWMARVGTRLELAADEIAAARRWSEQVDDPFWGPVSQARVQLAEGERSDAFATLEMAQPRCARHEVVQGLLRSRSAGSPDESVKHLASALELAAAAGMLQTVASEGAETLELVEHAAWRLPQGWVDHLRRAVRASSAGALEPRRARRSPPRAVRTRARRPALPAEPAHATGNRRRALPVGEHAEVPPEGHLPQAGRPLPRRGSRAGKTDGLGAPRPQPWGGVRHRAALIAALRAQHLGLLLIELVRGQQSPTAQIGERLELLDRIDDHRNPTSIGVGATWGSHQQVPRASGCVTSHHHPPVGSSVAPRTTASNLDAGIRSPATMCPPTRWAATDSGSAQRSSVTRTRPADAGWSASAMSSMSRSVSNPPISLSSSLMGASSSTSPSSRTSTSPSWSRVMTTTSSSRTVAASTSSTSGGTMAANEATSGTTTSR